MFFTAGNRPRHGRRDEHPCTNEIVSAGLRWGSPAPCARPGELDHGPSEHVVRQVTHDLCPLRRQVVVKSTDADHCSGKYPFQCCCKCAVSEGWTGWEVQSCTLHACMLTLFDMMPVLSEAHTHTHTQHRNTLANSARPDTRNSRLRCSPSGGMTPMTQAGNIPHSLLCRVRKKLTRRWR